MSEKAIPDPGAVGWVQDAENPEFWTWEATGNLVEEAPDDGAQYGRESKTWTEIVMPEVPEETDPTVPDHVKAISTDDIANWSASYSWGDHGDAGYATMMWVQSNYQTKGDYLTDFTETDPTVPSHVKDITTTNISHWDQAWDEATEANGWGNHADAGYATETWVNNKGYSTYTGGDAVKTSGNQTIGGAKTFSSNVTAPDFVATSDERLKKNVCTAPTGVIEKIRGVEFEWKESGQLSSGVIAQELEAIPELAHLVHTGEEDGTKHVSYLGLFGYLIEEVKSLRAELEALK